MDLKTMRSELAFMVNFTEGTADQDFAQTRLNKLLSRAYERIVERAKLQSHRSHWAQVREFTWAAGVLRLQIPRDFVGKVYIAIRDVTDSEVGVPINSGVDFFWYTDDTLQWNGTTGPGSARTIRFYYEATAEELLTDAQEPRLVPPPYHWLIVWQAALYARGIGDDQAPMDWRAEYRDMWIDFQKHVSRARPLTSTQTVITQGDTLGDPQTKSVDGFGNTGDGLNPP